MAGFRTVRTKHPLSLSLNQLRACVSKRVEAVLVSMAPITAIAAADGKGYHGSGLGKTQGKKLEQLWKDPIWRAEQPAHSTNTYQPSDEPEYDEHGDMDEDEDEEKEDDEDENQGSDNEEEDGHTDEFGGDGYDESDEESSTIRSPRRHDVVPADPAADLVLRLGHYMVTEDFEGGNQGQVCSSISALFVASAPY